MRVTVRYVGQLKQAAGAAAEAVEVVAPCSPVELLARRAGSHGDELRRLLLDPSGRLHPTILVFIGDEQVTPDERLMLKDGDVVTVLSPVAGG